MSRCAADLARRIRAQHDLTQEDAARLWGVTLRCWHGWERGQRMHGSARVLVDLAARVPGTVMELNEIADERDAAS